jgi:hypothetical protein
MAFRLHWQRLCAILCPVFTKYVILVEGVGLGIKAGGYWQRLPSGTRNSRCVALAKNTLLLIGNCGIAAYSLRYLTN